MDSAISLAMKLIERFEGLRLKPYACPAGVATIGFGTTVYPDGRKVSLTDPPITVEAARDMLAIEVARFAGRVDALVLVPLKAHEMAALVSLVYNIGSGAFRGSTLLKKLNSGDRLGASQQFIRWNRAGGRILPGLTKRRAEERRLFTGA